MSTSAREPTDTTQEVRETLARHEETIKQHARDIKECHSKIKALEANNSLTVNGSGDTSTTDRTVATAGSSDTSLDLLTAVVTTANKQKPSDVLLQVCKQNPEAKKLASSLLLSPSTKTTIEPLMAKRKRETEEMDHGYRRCSRCQLMVEVNEWLKGYGCYKHLGKVPSHLVTRSYGMSNIPPSVGTREVNYESVFWADNDEKPDSFKNEPLFQAGFEWSCYGKDGNDVGCEDADHDFERFTMTAKKARW